MGNLIGLRKQLRDRRRQIVGIERMQASISAMQYAQQFIGEKPVLKKVGVFFSLAEEIDTMPLIQWLWQLGYHVYLPVVIGKNQPLVWHSYTPTSEIIIDKLGIFVPKSGRIDAILDGLPDLTVVPLVGFDERGNRLGMGGGFYDRTFQNKQPKQFPWLLGLAYACQGVLALEVREWDIPVDAIATDQFLKYFH